MAIQFHNYGDYGFTENYYKVREFLIKLNDTGFPFGRWDWMITHRCLEKEAVCNIGLWEDDGELVGLATFDAKLGEGFCLTYNEYCYLKKDMLLYAEQNFSNNGEFAVMIKDSDSYFQEVAAKEGFIATTGKDNDAVIPIDLDQLHYNLPEGFHITSMKETYDLYKYGQVLWKGFNHELNGEGTYHPSMEDIQSKENEMLRPNVNLDLKIAVVAPNGDFVSYCGMWFDPASENALVEPVATDPDYRKLGLGRAAVLEGIRRCGLLGAKRAFVGSSQQFYYSIGFRPYATYTWWKRK